LKFGDAACICGVEPTACRPFSNVAVAAAPAKPFAELQATDFNAPVRLCISVTKANRFCIESGHFFRRQFLNQLIFNDLGFGTLFTGSLA
jgi:hypothetical protein